MAASILDKEKPKIVKLIQIVATATTVLKFE
jgi:hypothetical protein